MNELDLLQQIIDQNQLLIDLLTISKDSLFFISGVLLSLIIPMTWKGYNEFWTSNSRFYNGYYCLVGCIWSKSSLVTF